MGVCGRRTVKERARIEPVGLNAINNRSGTATSITSSTRLWVSTRLAARISSRMARPRGLLVLLPGYEPQFTSKVPLEELD